MKAAVWGKHVDPYGTSIAISALLLSFGLLVESVQIRSWMRYSLYAWLSTRHQPSRSAHACLRS